MGKVLESQKKNQVHLKDTLGQGHAQPIGIFYSGAGSFLSLTEVSVK